MTANLLAGLVVFAAVTLFTPGPNNVMLMTSGLNYGLRRALPHLFGVAIGFGAMVLAVGIGLGAVFETYPALYPVIKYVGVAYLLFLGWKTLRAPLVLAGAPQVRPRRAFRDGFLVNVTNPKVILFILAFIPQFVDPARGSVLAQFLIFGSVIAAGGFVINAAVGWGAGGIGRALARDQRIERALRIVSASVFGLLAAKLAWTKLN